MECLYIPFHTAQSLFLCAGMLIISAFLSPILMRGTFLGKIYQDSAGCIWLLYGLLGIGLVIFWLSGIQGPTAEDFAQCSRIIAPFGMGK